LAGAPIRPRFPPNGRALARSFPAHAAGLGMPSLAANMSRRLFPPRRDGSRGLPRLFQYRGWRRLWRAAIEGPLRRISHVKLDGLCSLDAPNHVDDRDKPGSETR
jgi:hypothetical protein